MNISRFGQKHLLNIWPLPLPLTEWVCLCECVCVCESVCVWVCVWVWHKVTSLTCFGCLHSVLPCVCVCVCVCVTEREFVCKFVCVCVYFNVHTFMWVYVWVFPCVCILMCVWACVYMCVGLSQCVQLGVCIHTSVWNPEVETELPNSLEPSTHWIAISHILAANTHTNTHTHNSLSLCLFWDHHLQHEGFILNGPAVVGWGAVLLCSEAVPTWSSDTPTRHPL